MERGILGARDGEQPRACAPPSPQRQPLAFLYLSRLISEMVTVTLPTGCRVAVEPEASTGYETVPLGH